MAHGEATNNLYFYEDEVYRIDHRGRVKFGLIMENFEGTPSDSEDYALNKGEVRVIWHPEGKEQILNESQVRQGLWWEWDGEPGGYVICLMNF